MSRRKVRIQELADYLGTSVHTLYKKVQKNEIPFERLGRGRSLYFDLDAINAHMKVQGNGDAVELQSPKAAQREEVQRLAGEILASV